MGQGKKIYSNNSLTGDLLFFILMLSASRGGGFSRDFTANLAPQCRAFRSLFKTLGMRKDDKISFVRGVQEQFGDMQKYGFQRIV